MSLSIRTPYKNILTDFTDFASISTKTDEGVLVISNNMPPALHILEPGFVKVKLKNSKEADEFSGEIIHSGGWAVIHPDNTCEISLLEGLDKKDLNASGLSKSDFIDDNGNVFVEKIQKKAYERIS